MLNYQTTSENTLLIWFYVIPENDWREPSAPYGAELSIGSSQFQQGFFDTHVGCGYTVDHLRELQAHMEAEHGLLDPEEEGRLIRVTRPPRSRGHPNQPRRAQHSHEPSSTPSWVWLVIFVILLIVIGLVILLGYLDSRSTKKRADNA